MEYRSSLGDQTFPRLLRRWDGRSIGQFESRLRGKKLTPPGGRGNWSVRRLASSTILFNAVLWMMTAFVLWWATSL
jgi:hypothetical protein